ncbi:MAG: tRNA-dihydrouridine synthase family protein [Clostridia bacterium]|nr:tRNA-dihydrouridine synthase family protein [Clostridia bacterium]
MAGPGDSGFRRICRECGADYTVSEMISAKAILFGSDKTVMLARHTEEEKPMLIQLFGNEPQAMEYAAKFIWERFSPVGIDLNFGCPAPKIFNNGDGSALLRQPSLSAALVQAARKGCNDGPVSVKMRIGIDEPDPHIIDFAREMERAGAAFITVHGRTREQFYSGKADYEAIRRIKEAVSIPIIANGDVVDGASAQRILRETGADGVMLARGALGAPDVFSRIKSFMGGMPEPSISMRKRFELCFQQLLYTVEDKGEERACVEFRKHLLWYLKGIPGAGAYKAEAGRVCTVNDCKELLTKVFKEQEI